MRVKVGRAWVDHGPGSAVAGGTLGGSAIVPHLSGAPKQGHAYVPRKTTQRAWEAAIECNERGSVAAGARALGISRTRVNRLVRRA